MHLNELTSIPICKVLNVIKTCHFHEGISFQGLREMLEDVRLAEIR